MYQTHELVQGTPEWDLFRLDHDGASEAAAMLGISKKTTRNELLRIKHTGIPKQFSDWVRENILDHGHAVEADARPIVEGIIGQDLYPVTCSNGRMSASCDGLTIDDSIAFEHKQWNEALAAAVAANELPDEYMPQCQQIMMVTPAEKVIFVVSDGTEENMVWMWVYPDPDWFARINAGWKQFHRDLENYSPVEVVEKVVAEVVENLPALSVQVQGAVALITNMDPWGDALRGFIKNIPSNPSTDQEFANCKDAVKKLQEAQDRLDAAEQGAMGQIATFDEMRRAKQMLWDLARNTRLALEKLVERREKEIKTEIMAGGKDKLKAYIDKLNTQIGKPYVPQLPADWAAAIKSKRNIESIHNAVDTLLANKKVEADAIYDRVTANLASLRELGANHNFLFSDEASIIQKANDDLILLIKSRITTHAHAEAKRLEDQRAAMQREEQAKAEAAAQAEVNRKVAEQLAADRVAEAAQKEAEKGPAPASVETLGQLEKMISEKNERLGIPGRVVLTGEKLVSVPQHIGQNESNPGDSFSKTGNSLPATGGGSLREGLISQRRTMVSALQDAYAFLVGNHTDKAATIEHIAKALRAAGEPFFQEDVA